MKIIILGAGRVGSSLASTLSKQQYEVSVIDLSKESFKDFKKILILQLRLAMVLIQAH